MLMKVARRDTAVAGTWKKNIVKLITSRVTPGNTEVPGPTLWGTSDSKKSQNQEKNNVERVHEKSWLKNG